MKTLSIIGCGKVGTTLGKLFESNEVFEIKELVASTETSVEIAAKHFKSATAHTTIKSLLPADVFMITTPDDQISRAVGGLRENGLIKSDTIVFHCSGAHSSEILRSEDANLGFFASVHPVKSFIAEETVNFPGTYCGVEGDKDALEILKRAFEQIGGKFFQLDSDKKLVYHAGSVFVCNYLTSLLELGIRCFREAGLEGEGAIDIVSPIIKETLSNILEHGTSKSLTGPIARGDAKLVREEISAVKSWDIEIAELYRRLGLIALEIAENKGEMGKEKLLELKSALSI